MKKSATLYLERWSIPYRSVGLSRTGASVYPVQERTWIAQVCGLTASSAADGFTMVCRS